MALEVDVERRIGALALRARFSCAPGVTALIGPSGAGKTSLVNLIAGLLRPDRGRIAVDGTVLFSSEAGLSVPPHRRRVGYVFQEPRLFPHLSVRRNLLYGRWFARRAAPVVSLERVVGLLDLGALLARTPATLSGGEKQRVAIGRALLAAPRLLLMDEPLNSLDPERRAELYPFIERLAEAVRIPVVYVTHRVEEVARLADSIVMLRDGAVEADGPAIEMLARLDLGALSGQPASGAVVPCRVAGHDERYALSSLDFEGGRFSVPRLSAPIGAAVRVHVRARDVSVAIEQPRGLSVQNVFSGTVEALAPSGAEAAQLSIRVGGAVLLARVTRRAAEELALRPGLSVYALVKSVAFGSAEPGAGG
jgi:molybdate transport system ATP-binding protein